MKKITLILIFSLFFIIHPFSILAQVGVPVSPSEMPDGCMISLANHDRIDSLTNLNCLVGFCSFDSATHDCAICCLMNIIINVTNWIFIFLMAIVIIFVLLGAFFILTAGGDTEKVKKGRNFIIYAVIGLLVALLARAVPAIVRVLGGF